MKLALVERLVFFEVLGLADFEALPLYFIASEAELLSFEPHAAAQETNMLIVIKSSATSISSSCSRHTLHITPMRSYCVLRGRVAWQGYGQHQRRIKRDLSRPMQGFVLYVKF